MPAISWSVESLMVITIINEVFSLSVDGKDYLKVDYIRHFNAQFSNTTLEFFKHISLGKNIQA